MLPRALQELSLKERREAMNDIHGVPEELEEPSGSDLQRVVADLEPALDSRLVTTNPRRISTYAYKRALESSPEYVTSSVFRLRRMLRADRFDAGRAAERKLRYALFLVEAQAFW